MYRLHSLRSGQLHYLSIQIRHSLSTRTFHSATYATLGKGGHRICPPPDTSISTWLASSDSTVGGDTPDGPSFSLHSVQKSLSHLSTLWTGTSSRMNLWIRSVQLSKYQRQPTKGMAAKELRLSDNKINCSSCIHLSINGTTRSCRLVSWKN